MVSKNEIDRVFDMRLKSDEWDMMIARKVVSRKRKRAFMFSGAAALATAASIVFAVNFTVMNSRAADPVLSTFMSAQIEGSMKDANLTVADTDFFEFEE